MLSEMTKEKLLLTMKGCGGCAQVKEMLKDDLKSGKIRELTAESAEGKKVADMLKLEEVPECIEKGEDGSYKVCSLEAMLKNRSKA